tara:strand:- start:166 stop:1020 length:855 start_codon:yes stop_codon:yes gene_type:complete
VFNLKLTILAFLVSILFLSFVPDTVLAQVGNVVSISTTTCNSGSSFNAGDCTATPDSWKTSIYEMGLCSKHPFDASKLGSSFDRSSCVITYSDTNPNPVDVAQNISGAAVPLPGTSFAPSSGSYGFPYIIMSSSFETSATFTNTVDTYYSTTNCKVSTSESDSGECTDLLVNFSFSNDLTECASGYIGASVLGGTMDGFVTNVGLTRSPQSGGANAGSCVNSGRVIGVMNLSAPVTITSQTISVIFNFVLTGYGSQFSEDTGDGVADEYGSGPFSGYFVVTNLN